jgi:ferredoxin
VPLNPASNSKLDAAAGAPGRVVIPAARLDGLVQALKRRGYRVHAPVLDHGTLVIRPIESAAELPRGVVDEQSPGTYRLTQKGDRFFDYTVPADSWKRLFFPARLLMWQASLKDGKVTATEERDSSAPLALLGVRGCDLEAILIQDRVFMGGNHPDPPYRARRERAFIVAVNCARATSTCFCPSMEAGPQARRGYDLAITELVEGDHRFVVESATENGRELVAGLFAETASAADIESAESTVAATAASITRTMPPDIAATLRNAQASPRWQSIADRCLACGNCTLVCPTCFCSAVEHTSDLEGTDRHERRWDSCFNSGHSYIHGGSVRSSTAPRYRQWLTHKLSSWHDQFDTAGCSGCGRCIAWCPVAIDITEEAHAFTAAAAAGAGGVEQ